MSRLVEAFKMPFKNQFGGVSTSFATEHREQYFAKSTFLFKYSKSVFLNIWSSESCSAETLLQEEAGNGKQPWDQQHNTWFLT